jgi:hypothetical protein
VLRHQLWSCVQLWRDLPLFGPFRHLRVLHLHVHRSGKWYVYGNGEIMSINFKVLVFTVLIGCSPDHTPDEAISVCHKVCGERPLDSFDYKGDMGLWVDCRCGKLEVKCDSGSCVRSEQ